MIEYIYNEYMEEEDGSFVQEIIIEKESHFIRARLFDEDFLVMEVDGEVNCFWSWNQVQAMYG